MIFEKIKELILERLADEGIEADEGDVTLSSNLKDFKMDSIVRIMIIDDIEREFDIAFDTEAEINSIGDLVRFVENRKQ